MFPHELSDAPVTDFSLHDVWLQRAEKRTASSSRQEGERCNVRSLQHHVTNIWRPLVYIYLNAALRKNKISPEAQQQMSLSDRARLPLSVAS